MFITTIQPTGAFEWTQETWGPALRCRPLSATAQHLFTARNLELRCDEAEWAQVAASLGVAPDDLLLLEQVHGSDVAVARRDRKGGWRRPKADVIVSDDQRVAVGVRVADCAPILLADPRRGCVAAAHAGWRGTVNRVAAAAVHALHREFDSTPADLVAAIGPCLGPCCGEVGNEVVSAFRDAGHAERDLARWFTTGPSTRPFLDLWGANRDQLAAAGVPAHNIAVAEFCTKTYAATFHSYRAAGAQAGRMLAVIRPFAPRAATLPPRPSRDSTGDQRPC